MSILGASILLRLVGIVYSVLLLYYSRDRRFAFLTVMLGLMASRQLWTARTSVGTNFDELPGFVVSVLAVATVHYLAQYVEEENRIKDELAAANDRLRSFRKAVEHAGHAIFLTDPDGRIEYANPATADVTGYEPVEVVGETPRLWKSGEHDEAFYAELWETITDGEIWDGEIVNRRKDGDLCWVDMTIAPITDEDGAVEQFVAVDTDVTERKERELRIREQHARLDLLNTTNEVVRDVNRELVRADSREEVEAAACERFAAASPYESAWLATRNAVNDTVRARAHTGIDDAAMDEIVATVNDAGRETVVDLALETDATQIARPDGSCAGDGDCTCYVHADAAATVAIPLSYRDAHYGALVLHANDADATDALDVEVLDELGETIAYAINAAESKRSLVTDRVTALTFRLTPEDDPLPALAAALDCSLDLKRVSASDDGTPVEFVDVEGVDADAVLEYAAGADVIDAARLVCESDDGALFRFDVREPSIVTTLAEYGAVVRSLSADGAESRLSAELPETTDVRSVVEAVSANHPGADLVGRRERDRAPETRGRFRATVEDRFTDRQLEAVEMAHFSGFYEWPRETSGEELADRMGVCQSTFLQHLRAGQRKVFEAFFDADDASMGVRRGGVPAEAD
ncbi:bacterio-opsin activator domain-containing protein [Salinilacihabitans rarus]|uniref:bacterio-opsin activator domain-containing protein n=1 Tax=Salinilacihabitans rarus TaxID=2961596 RepID=UPI0020C8FE85|nr:bacterio-opsin activator domain-containing protein [Salinilacihabitans rarus]